MEYLVDSDYEIAEKNGISRVRAYQRFYDYGWSRKDSITIPVKKKNQITKEQYERAAKNGISRSTLQTRVFQLKWDIETAITKAMQVQKRLKP